MEHWGVTLLLLYRAIACLAAPLWACSRPVTLIRSNFKGNHDGSENMEVLLFGKSKRLFFFRKNTQCKMEQCALGRHFAYGDMLAVPLYLSIIKQGQPVWAHIAASSQRAQSRGLSNTSERPNNAQIFNQFTAADT